LQYFYRALRNHLISVNKTYNVLNWLKTYLEKRNISSEDPFLEDQNQVHFVIFLFTGVFFSVIYLLYKEIIRTDLSNPLAEATTVLMFTSALFFLLRHKNEMSFNMLFFIPFLAYLYYHADFSRFAPNSTNLYFLLSWYLAGMAVLALWVPYGFRYFLFLISGFISILYHCIQAGIMDQFLSPDQILIYNPFLILVISFMTFSLIRIRQDSRWNKLQGLRKEFKQLFLDFFFLTKHPLVKIRVIRDQDKNVVRMEIDKINHAFESAFRTSIHEAKGQELHFYFKLIFRSNTDWNSLFLIDKKQQAEIYSPATERWFLIHILWFSATTCFCVVNDKTLEKKEIKNLQDTKARYLALLEAIPDIFFVIDKDGIFQDVVFKGQESLLYETSEVIGNSVFKVGFSEMMARKIFDCIQKAISNDSIETIEYSLDARGGSLLFEMRLAKLDNQSVISISRDISRRKKAEFELEAAKIRAEEADSLKSKFLANLSHDIRTPVNIIVGLTKLLAEPSLSEYEKGEFVHDVQQQGNTLLQIIENTIHLSKIETNTLDVHFTYTNIHRLLRELYLHFYPLLPDHRDVRLIMHTEIESAEVGFETDPNLLKEALYRLIDNAVRFTSMGTITFGYSTAPGNRVEFFVSDSGQGIPLAEQENIFLRFYVIEADRLAQRSGPGLGLPIAQHFVALLGGELMVDSDPGKGSRFWFRLPIKNAKGFLRVV
jgi:PAS domain S-box-containing protein